VTSCDKLTRVDVTSYFQARGRQRLAMLVGSTENIRKRKILNVVNQIQKTYNFAITLFLRFSISKLLICLDDDAALFNSAATSDGLQLQFGSFL
jgi:hypothetical protein